MFPLSKGFRTYTGVHILRNEITCSSIAAGAEAVNAITGALERDLSPEIVKGFSELWSPIVDL